MDIFYDAKSWFLNIALVLLCIFYFLPNIIANEDELIEEYGTLKKVYIETYKYKPRRSFHYIDKERLVLITSDRVERKYKLSDTHQRSWPKLQNENAIGKELRVLLRIDGSRMDPVKVELDRKNVYGRISGLLFDILIVVLTLGYTLFNLYNVSKT
jgi:hypothetical protein